jgi:hypothetical protein
VDNTITTSDFINSRSQPKEVQEEPTQVGQPVENTEVAKEPEQESPEQVTTEETSADVLSHVDLDNMSESELKEMGQKLGTKAVARFGELTARRKQAEERMQVMEQELQQLKQSNTQTAPKVKDNPLAKVKTVNELQKHQNAAQEVIEWAEDLLDKHEDSSATSVITNVNNKEMTKADVKKHLRHSRNVVNKYVPAQVASLQRRSSLVNQAASYKRKALEEFDWIKDEKNDTTKKYSAMLNDKRLSSLQRTNPELSTQMPYILAHAANSMYGRKTVDATKAPMTPPKPVGGNAATSERKPSNRTAMQKEVSQQFKSSGNINDFIALRTLQKS